MALHIIKCGATYPLTTKKNRKDGGGFVPDGTIFLPSLPGVGGGGGGGGGQLVK